MPELPEVEQVRLSLLPHVKGKTVCKADSRKVCPLLASWEAMLISAMIVSFFSETIRNISWQNQ